MNYEEFRAVVMEKLQAYYGEETEISVEPMNKGFDKSYDGLIVRKPEMAGQPVPVINLEMFYGRYMDGIESVEYWCDAMIQMINDKDGFEEVCEIRKMILNWAAARDKVLPRFMPMNYEPDPEKNFVLRSFYDLTVGYVIADSFAEEAAHFVRVSKPLLSLYGISENDLHEQAMKNLRAMGHELNNMNIAGALTGEFLKPCEGELEPDKLYVLKSSMPTGGAVVLLDEELIRDVLKDTDCYLIPSSTHELIVMVDNGNMDYQTVNQMIQDINETEVAEYDRLADHCFYYEGSSGRIISLYDEECQRAV